jgi:hypothetical protein
VAEAKFEQSRENDDDDDDDTENRQSKQSQTVNQSNVTDIGSVFEPNRVERRHLVEYKLIHQREVRSIESCEKEKKRQKLAIEQANLGRHGMRLEECDERRQRGWISEVKMASGGNEEK